MSFNTPSRRTVVRTAAWSVPAVTVATAAPAFAATPTTIYGAGAGSSTYAANLTAPIALAFGNWTVEVTSPSVLKSVGPEAPDAPAPSFVATITSDTAAADQLRQFGVEQISGTATSTYTQSPASAATLNANFTIPNTPVPATGPIVVVATGTGSPIADAAQAASVATVMGNIIAQLTLTPPAAGFVSNGTMEFTGSATLA